MTSTGISARRACSTRRRCRASPRPRRTCTTAARRPFAPCSRRRAARWATSRPCRRTTRTRSSSTCGRGKALPAALDRAIDLALRVGGLLRLALVVQLLVRDEPELGLDQVALEVERQRDQREALLL